MFLTIILWWVPAAAILTFLGCIIADEWRDRKIDWGENASSSAAVLAFGWIGGGFIWAFLTLGSTAIPSGDQRLVSRQEFKVSDTAKLEYNGQYEPLTFISEDENGKLSPQSLEPDDIVFENLDGKTVVLETFDHYHTWLAHWPTQTTSIATIK